MGWGIFSRILSLVLFIAAIMKARDLPFDRVDQSDFFWAQHGIDVFVILAQFALGSLLASGLLPVVTWWVAVVSFIGMMGISLDRALTGAESCGCFGSLQVSPWYTAGFDFLAWSALLIFRPRHTLPSSHRPRFVVFAIIFILSIGGLGTYSFYERARVKSFLATDTQETHSEPRQWIGKPFPLLPYIDVGARLRDGEWVLMFYNRRCSICQESMPRLLAMAYQNAGEFSRVRVAIIEVPPFTETADTSASSTAWTSGKLTGERKWRGLNSKFFKLRYGTVEAYADSLNELLQQAEQIRFRTGENSDGVLFPDYRRVRKEMFLREIACGPLSLVAILHDLGIPRTPSEAEILFAEAGSQGIDMLRLKALAEERGLSALGVAVTSDQLSRLNRRAIVHLNGIGFAAVLGFVPGGVKIVYPLQPPGIIPRSVFDPAFGKEGHALLIDVERLDPQKLGIAQPSKQMVHGPRLRLSRSIVAAGLVHREDWKSSITVFNDGDEPLLIDKVKPECCVKAIIEKQRLTPGESTELRVMSERMLLGGFATTITLFTNDSRQPVHKIPVRAYLEPPVFFERPAVMFEKVLPGDGVSHTVGLDVSPTVKPGDLRLHLPPEAPLTAKIETDTRGDCALSVHWSGQTAPGWYRYAIEITQGPRPAAAPSFVHLAFHVVPAVEVFPPSTLISESDWRNGWSRTVRLKLNKSLAGKCSAQWSERVISERVKSTIQRRDDLVEIVLRAAPGPPPDRGRFSMEILFGGDRSAHSFLLITRPMAARAAAKGAATKLRAKK